MMAKKTTQTPADLLAAVLVPKEAQPYAIPANWRWVRLGSVCEFERGITFPASAKESAPTEENIPCLRTANVQDQLEIDDLIYVNKSYMKKNDAKLVRQGDIVMSSANSRELVGKTSFVESLTVPMTFGGFVLMIRAKQIANKFLFYFLRLAFLSGHFVGKASQTTNIANINTKTLAQDAIPLPPLAEQARIVARIETLFAQIDEAEEKLRAADDTFAARRAALLHAAFTGRLTKKWRAAHAIKEEQEGTSSEIWQWGNLIPDAAECLDSYRKPVNATERAARLGEIPYYGATGQVGWIDDYLTNEQLVLVGEDGAPFFDMQKDKAYIIEGKAWVNNHAHILKSKFGETGNKFLVYYLNSFDYHGYVNGTTRPKLTQGNMKKIPFPMPSLDEQREIVRLLDDAFAEEERARQALEAARAAIPALRRAILARAFRGALGTGDPAEPPADLSAAR